MLDFSKHNNSMYNIFKANGSVMMKGKMSDEIFLEIFFCLCCCYFHLPLCAKAATIKSNQMKAISSVQVHENEVHGKSLEFIVLYLDDV